MTCSYTRLLRAHPTIARRTNQNTDIKQTLLFFSKIDVCTRITTNNAMMHIPKTTSFIDDFTFIGLLNCCSTVTIDGDGDVETPESILQTGSYRSGLVPGLGFGKGGGSTEVWYRLSKTSAVSMLE